MTGVLGALRLPVIGAPMFLASSPRLVLAQCRAGVIGAFPALNARSSEILDDWLSELRAALDPQLSGDAVVQAPFAVNQIVSHNPRMDADLELCVKHRVPLVITSVGHPRDVVAAVHSYGGHVLHDVASVRHAEKAAAAGVDGLILLGAGAGGHSGWLNPFAFVKEARAVFDGSIVLAGGITRGRDILAARLIGADAAYVGTRFLATAECEVESTYKQMLVDANADDIVATTLFSGMQANYLSASIRRAGLDPAALPEAPGPGQGTGGHGEFKLWRDIWAAGHGVGDLRDVPSVAELVDRLETEYRAGIAWAGRIPTPSSHA